MHIAYFAHEIGQSETFIQDLIKGLSKTVELTVITSTPIKPAGKVSVLRRRIKFHHNKLSNKIFTIIGNKQKNKFDKFYAYHSIKALLKNNKFDIAFIDYGTTAVLLKELLNDKGIPFIVHFHGYDITSSLNNYYYKQELKTLFSTSHKLIAASNHIKRLLILQGAEPDKVEVIRYGIDAANLSPVSWEEKFSRPPSIVFLGRLTPKKNPIALIHAFSIVAKRIPNATLSLIGDGPLKAEIISTIKRLELEKSVHLYGKKSQTEALSIVKYHWLYAQHSVTSYQGDQEGFAISIAEASALKLPIVATLHNGIPENVIDEVTGFLVKEYDYESMASQIIKLLLDKELVIAMGEAGRARVLEHYKPEYRINNFIALFNSILNNAIHQNHIIRL